MSRLHTNCRCFAISAFHGEISKLKHDGGVRDDTIECDDYDCTRVTCDHKLKPASHSQYYNNITIAVVYEDLKSLRQGIKTQFAANLQWIRKPLNLNLNSAGHARHNKERSWCWFKFHLSTKSIDLTIVSRFSQVYRFYFHYFFPVFGPSVCHAPDCQELT